MAGKLSKKKIGLYGGTFDPIHFGHLNLAIELMEKQSLDEVWFIPTHLNPLKFDRHPSSIEHRLKMVQLAIEKIPQFKLKDIESHRAPPSYTIDTLHELMAQEANEIHHLYLLLGQDSIPGFYHWQRVDEIVDIIPLLIASRTGEWHSAGQKPHIETAIQKGLVQTRYMDITSTEIRDRLSKGLYCGHLVPHEVLSYIHEQKLFS